MDPLSPQPPQSKTKVLLPLILAVVIILLGLWWLEGLKKPSSSFSNNPAVVKETAADGQTLIGFPYKLIPQGVMIKNSTHYIGSGAISGKDIWVTRYFTPMPIDILLNYYSTSLLQAAGYKITRINPGKGSWSLTATSTDATVTVSAQPVTNSSSTSVFVSYMKI